MNKLQKTYMIAEATYTTACKMVDEETKKAEELNNNEELSFEQWEAIREKYQTEKLFKALRAAESNMIAWANNKVSKSSHFKAAHKQAMAEIMENIHMPKIRKQMVDLAFRLK